MTVSEHRTHTDKNKTELLEELIDLTKQLRAKNAEIANLRKKLNVYKSL